MKLLLPLLSIFFLLSYDGIAQDTVFHKVTTEYESTITKHRYDLYAIAKYFGKIDTVFKYDYGAYMHVKIDDVVIVNNHHFCIYETVNNVSYSVYEYTGHKWVPLMGGALFFFNNSNEKVDVSVMDKDKIRVTRPQKTVIYKLDFLRKAIEVYDDK